MSELLPHPTSNGVYIGFSVNRSLGTVRGATLTLNRRDGALLIAFLALFVGAIGRALWKFLRLALHLWYSSNKDLSAVYHQSQAILRNSDLAHDAAQSFFQLSFVWRRHVRSGSMRPLNFGLVAGISSIGIVLTGAFSSRISNATPNEVRLSGNGCSSLPGEITWDQLSNADLQLRYSYYYKQTTAYLLYATECYYAAEPAHTPGCQIFTQSVLPYTVSLNASCPFAPEICKTADNNIHFDTGYLDSVDHLGWDTGPRFLLRHTLHCAPLVTQGFTEVLDVGRPSISYKYGNLDGETSYLFRRYLDNETLDLSVDAKPAYDVYPVDGAAYKGVTPKYIDQLNVAGAETSLLFLVTSGLWYQKPTTDPWFSATTPRQLSSKDGNRTVYVPDEPVAPMGCTTSRQYCNPDMPKDRACIDSADKNFSYVIARVWPSREDQEHLRPVFMVLDKGGFSDHLMYYYDTGMPNLLARMWVVQGLGQYIDIPDGHWKKEIEYVFRATLAGMQGTLTEFAKGFWVTYGYWCKDEPCRRLCDSQRARSSVHNSFSVLGLLIILCTGAVTIPLAIFLEEVLDAAAKLPVLRKSSHFKYAHAEWRANSILQLQRLAHEGLQLGTWSRANETVPITTSGEELGVLDVSDARHPKLVRPICKQDSSMGTQSIGDTSSSSNGL